MQNTIDTIYDRRSVRQYLDKPVNTDLIDEVIKAGMFAPSGINRQPWHFIVFNDKDKIQELKNIHPYASSLKTAPVCIMVCGDKEREMAPGFYITDCSAATENILLAAKSLGLDTCWMGIYPWEELTQNIASKYNLPQNIIPFCLIALGYGAVAQERPMRYDANRIHYNGW